MSSQTLKHLLIQELRDIYSAENQTLYVLPKLAEAASSPELRKAFQSHLLETEEQVIRLQQVFHILQARPGGNMCEATQGLIEEIEEILLGGYSGPVLDVALIMAAQKVEHYEIAGYGSLRALATACGMTDIAQLLEQTLDQEKAADERLSYLAEHEINPHAARSAR